MFSFFGQDFQSLQVYPRSFLGSLGLFPYHVRERFHSKDANRLRLLCMPGGGLNDLLCTTLRFYKYSLRSARTLYIGSKYSSVGPLDDLFLGWPKSINFLDSDYEYFFDSSSTVFPKRSKEYVISKSSDLGVFVTNDENVYITFDVSKKYNEDLLVHVGRGGGFGFDMIRLLQINIPYRDIVINRLRSLPSEYESVQIRNSDIQTNWKNLLDHILELKSHLPLLVCSDSDFVINQFKEKLSKTRKVFSLRKPTDDNLTVPVHYSSSKSQFDKNCEMLIDLFCMAFSKRLHIARSHSGISGFPRLALSLHLHQDTARKILAM